MSKHPPDRTPRSSESVRPITKTPQSSSDVERALALRDVMDHAVRVQRDLVQTSAKRRSRAREIAVVAVCVPLLALCVYSWVARPAAIWGAGPAQVQPARRDANVRVAMFLLAQRIEAYRHTSGAYPRALDQIGLAPVGVAYTLVSDSVFELRSPSSAAETGALIVLRSNEDTERFLGNSMSMIGGERTK